MTTEKCCANCSFNGHGDYSGCQHPNAVLDGKTPTFTWDAVDYPCFDYKLWKDAAHGCTCTFTGPRPLEGETMCQNCKDFHARYFPAFPGDPDWHLNHGAVNKNVWGIRPAAIKTRSHERVTELQIDAARLLYDQARERLGKLLIMSSNQE